MGQAITLPGHALAAAALRARWSVPEETPLRRREAAVAALTDFNRESPLCVAPDCPAPNAWQDMVRLGVHALLVAGPAPAGRWELLGLLTHRRLERRVRLRTRPAPVRATAAWRVEDLMTPRDELALVHYESLGSLRVWELHQMFQGSGLTHVLVIEQGSEHSVSARGLISRAAIARRLERADGEGREAGVVRRARRTDENFLMT